MTLSIMGIMNQIENDNLVLPSIQREFVWGEEQIKNLLDSIMRGYPVGIALLWETYDDIQYREFIKDYWEDNQFAFRSNTRRKKLKVVLDGQQRLQSLYVALCGKHEGKELYLDILSGKETDNSAEEKYVFSFMSETNAREQNESFDAALTQKEKDDQSEFWLKTSELYEMNRDEKKRQRCSRSLFVSIPKGPH